MVSLFMVGRLWSLCKDSKNKSGHPISEVAAVARIFPKMKHSSLISGSKVRILCDNAKRFMLVPYRKDTHLVKGCGSFHDIKKHYVSSRYDYY